MKKQNKPVKDKEQKKNKTGKVYPENDKNSVGPGSMDEGNLMNSGQSRKRSRTPHTKTFTTGTDSDGQTN